MRDSLSTSEVIEDTPNSTAPSKKKRKRKTVRIELVVDEDEAKIIDDNAEKMYLNRSEYLRAGGTHLKFLLIKILIFEIRS